MSASFIGSVRGRVLERTANEVTVEAGGIGYRVTVAPTTAATIGDEVYLHTHHHVRDDCHLLYGFASRDERTCFEALIGAHGVGPALALAILAVHRPDALRRALFDDDVDALCLVPGVGKKTAARLLVELKSRLAVPEFATDAAATAAAAAGTNGKRSVHVEVREALTALGYTGDEIRPVLIDLPSDGHPADLVRQALQRLGSDRVRA